MWFNRNAIADGCTVRHPLLGGDQSMLQFFQSLGVLPGVDHRGS